MLEVEVKKDVYDVKETTNCQIGWLDMAHEDATDCTIMIPHFL